MAELSVQIGADIKDLQKKVKTAEKDLKSLEKVSAKSGTNISKVGTNASKGIDKLSKSTANANPTLQEFSRVIQDAPYGIQGVGNNITQLTSQFGYLSKSAGGAVPALKLLASSFTGPAGILFAISTVVSILTVYGDEIANIIKGNSALVASQKAVTKALNEFYGDQVSKINSYVSILEDANTSETQRKNITDELIKVVPNLTKADFAYGNNLDIVKGKIGEYVLAQASRIEADTLVEENASKLAKKARIEQIKSIDDIQKRNEAYRKFLDKEGVATQKAVYNPTGVGVTKLLDKSEEEIKASFDKFASNLETELAPVQERINELYGITFSGGLDDVEPPSLKGIKERIKEAQKELSDLGDTFQFEPAGNDEDSLKGLEKSVKTRLAVYKKYLSTVKSISNEQAKEESERINNTVVEFGKAINKIDPYDGSLIDITKGFSEIVAVENKIKDIQNLLDKLGVDNINLEGLNLDQLSVFDSKLKTSVETSNIFSDAIGSSFQALSSQISDNLSTGSALVDSFTGSIISSLTKLVAEMIATSIAEKAIASTKVATNQAVATSSAIAGASESGAATGPGAIIAIPAMIATLVGLVGASFAAIGSFAKGSGGFSGDNNLAYLNRNEMILRPMEQSALYNAIRGHNLSSLSSNSTNSNSATEISIRGVLRGQNQVIQAERARKKYNRFYN